MTTESAGILLRFRENGNGKPPLRRVFLGYTHAPSRVRRVDLSPPIRLGGIRLSESHPQNDPL